MNSNTYTPRRSHRKRHSALRLSSDTTATLPEYTSPIWQRPQGLPDSDKPPDYPESADEADEDTDTDEVQTVYVPVSSPSPFASPRRARRYPGTAKRRQTGSISDLDTLLQRSVHALEMSNALLQSSMSTQSSLSALLASDNVTDLSLDRSTQTISTRMRGNGDAHEHWMDDLEEITKGVNGLFGEGPVSAAANSAESSVSRSLPTSSMPRMAHHRRRSSVNFRKAATTETGPHLHLSSEVDRTELIASAPRALTLYVASTDDPDSILLPSTLGLRTSTSAHNSSWQSPEPPPPLLSTMPYSGLHATASSPVLTDRSLDASTPAYNLLSSFVTHQAPCTPPSKTPSTFLFRRRSSSSSTNTSTHTERGISIADSQTKRAPQSLSDLHRVNRRGSGSRSRSLTPQRLQSSAVAPRPMTPPIEELSTASSSSASSDHPRTYRSVQCLRKILDEQPPNVDAKLPVTPERLKPPAFLPRSPPPAASSGTSTATASISRLLTKPTHHSSTRAPSPPRHSSLKRSSAPATPTLTPSPCPSPCVPEFFGAGVARVVGSNPSSGISTPKRISFAELPESYASSRPEGSSRFKEKKSRSRNKCKSKTKPKSQVDKAREDNGGWWTGWLLSAGAGSELSLSAQRYEERMEDRATRSWGRPGYGGMDDWAV